MGWQKFLFWSALITFHTFQLHAKHNAAFNLRHKPGTPILLGGSATHTLFSFSILTHLFSTSPTPVAIVWNKLIIHHRPRATITPALSGRAEKRGCDTTQGTALH